MFQSTACNAIHSIEQRTAKWIISAMDRTGDHVVPLTHDELASMLGVGRSYTSRSDSGFQGGRHSGAGRGALLVRNRDALLDRSCRCNESIKEHFEDVLRGVYPASSPLTRVIRQLSLALARSAFAASNAKDAMPIHPAIASFPHPRCHRHRGRHCLQSPGPKLARATGGRCDRCRRRYLRAGRHRAPSWDFMWESFLGCRHGCSFSPPSPARRSPSCWRGR